MYIFGKDIWIKQLSVPSAYNLDLLNPLDIIFLNKAKWTYKMEHFKRDTNHFIRKQEKAQPNKTMGSIIFFKKPKGE